MRTAKTTVALAAAALLCLAACRSSPFGGAKVGSAEEVPEALKEARAAVDDGRPTRAMDILRAARDVDDLPTDDRILEIFGHIGVQLGRVAERAHFQEHLRQSQKLEAIGQLAAGVAHEINNPMSYVRSNLRALEQQWDAYRSKLESDGELSGPLDEAQELLEESLDLVARNEQTPVRDRSEQREEGQREGTEPDELRARLGCARRSGRHAHEDEVADPEQEQGHARERQDRPLHGPPQHRQA